MGCRWAGRARSGDRSWPGQRLLGRYKGERGRARTPRAMMANPARIRKARRAATGGFAIRPSCLRSVDRSLWLRGSSVAAHACQEACEAGEDPERPVRSQQSTCPPDEGPRRRCRRLGRQNLSVWRGGRLGAGVESAVEHGPNRDRGGGNLLFCPATRIYTLRTHNGTVKWAALASQVEDALALLEFAKNRPRKTGAN